MPSATDDKTEPALSPEKSSGRPSITILGTALGLLGLALATFWFLRLPVAPSRVELKRRLKSIGEMTSLTPLVESRFAQSPDFSTIQNEKLVPGETVQTDGNGRAEIFLDTGESFELGENSRALFEIDTDGKTRITLLAGGVDLKSTLGGNVLFLRDGHIIGVEELRSARSHATVMAAKFTSGVVIPTKTLTAEEGNAALKAADAPPEDTDLANLSQDEILRSLQGQAPLFRKCYLNLLQETRNQTTKVNALVAFEIKANGKLTDVRVWHANTQSHIFLQCLSETFERTHFRPFQGDPIRVDEFPLTFE